MGRVPITLNSLSDAGAVDVNERLHREKLGYVPEAKSIEYESENIFGDRADASTVSRPCQFRFERFQRVSAMRRIFVHIYIVRLRIKDAILIPGNLRPSTQGILVDWFGGHPIRR